jgi:hypothetical protein
MSFESVLRTDLIDKSLLKDPESIKVVAENHFNALVNKAKAIERTRTPFPAKNIIEVMDLIRQAIITHEDKTHITEDAKVDVVYHRPDIDIDVEVVSMEFVKRQPGMFGQGRPFENKVANQKPLLREVKDDPDHPGYKRAVLGYFYDNVLRLTCWARTNKQANERALWLEQLMEEYTWFFVQSGVNRILFHGWQKNETLTVNDNKYYGRPIDFYVRTERLLNVSQKKLETICINMAAVLKP